MMIINRNNISAITIKLVQFKQSKVQLRLRNQCTSIRVSRSLRAASRTGCLLSPRRSTTAGTSPLKWSLKCSPDKTAADESDNNAPCETLKLLSFKRSIQQSTNTVTSDEDKLFLEASRSWWSRSTPAILSLVSLERAISRASSIWIWWIRR